MKFLKALLLLASFTSILYATPAKVRRSATHGMERQYIVVLHDSVPSAAVDGIAQSLSAGYDLTLHEVWRDSLRDSSLSAMTPTSTQWRAIRA